VGLPWINYQSKTGSFCAKKHETGKEGKVYNFDHRIRDYLNLVCRLSSILLIKTGRYVKSIVKALKHFILILVAAVGVYLLAAVVLSVVKIPQQSINCQEQTAFYVATNGVHLYIILPAESVDRQLIEQLNLPAGTRLIAFGWGDKNFYRNTPEWKNLTLSSAFKALFLKSATAINVTAYKQTYPFWRKMYICPVQLQQLADFISDSFLLNSAGKIIRFEVKKGYEANDSFYDAKGSFSLFKTCNVWVCQALKSANIETSVWSPFDFGVLYHFPKTLREDGPPALGINL
jgi:uncharacterized protein (TIGR02117 family)